MDCLRARQGLSCTGGTISLLTSVYATTIVDWGRVKESVTIARELKHRYPFCTHMRHSRWIIRVDLYGCPLRCTKPGSDLIAALLVLGLEPDCGLPVHCVGLGTTLTLVTEAPTVWYMWSFTLSHVFWLSVTANQRKRISRCSTIGTRYICHYAFRWGGDGDVDRFLRISMQTSTSRCTTDPHILAGVPFYGHPC